MKKRIAVFASGGGTNFQALIDGLNAGEICADIKVCISTRKDAYALERAKQNGIDGFVFRPKDFGSLDAMFKEIDTCLLGYGIDLIVLAGYMTVLPAWFVKKYQGKIINTHPALIPKHCGKGFYGMRVHEAVLAAGETESGSTVHYVDEGVDTGEVIAQTRVPVRKDDTPETLAERVMTAERQLLRSVVKTLCEA